MSRLVLMIGLAALAAATSAAQTRNVRELFSQLCAQCHGDDLRGGQAGSLIDDTWLTAGDDASIARAIREGIPERGMPPFGESLSSPEIRALVVYLREQRTHYQRRRPTENFPGADEVFPTEKHAFRMEIVADDLDTPWGMAWLPDGRMLITEKAGRLRIIEQGVLRSEPVKGTPEVETRGQAGLMEVALHPDHPNNGWIYLAYSHPAKNVEGDDASMTKIVRGRLRDNAWVDQETIVEFPRDTYRPGGGVHYGSRIAFDGRGYLFFSHGERGRQQDAQDLTVPNGKIHRVHDDGRIPADNPFLDHPGAIPSIWTYGNRNPQGLDFDPRTGNLWSTEHGPRGGDELNLIERGMNYGWPVITYGMNYNGTPMTDRTHQEGMAQPAIHWTPSIAVCGIDFYTGEQFPNWRGDLLVTALAQQHLRRVVIEDERVVHQEVLFQDVGRVRDVATGPDGAIYVAFNKPDKIVRLIPAE